jgi:hypothetical protein
MHRHQQTTLGRVSLDEDIAINHNPLTIPMYTLAYDLM